MRHDEPFDSDILRITQDFSGSAPSQHALNIARNLGLIADLGYCSMTLAFARGDELVVVAARRTTTAIGPEVKQRVGATLPEEERGGYDAFVTGAISEPSAPRKLHDREKDIVVEYVTQAFPVFEDERCVGVLICDTALAQYANPGRMEAEFMQMARELIMILTRRPLLTESGELFVTTRRPGDGVLRIDAQGHVEYPSPNAVAILRLAGYESRVRTSHAAELPGGGFAITPLVNKPFALQSEVSVAGRTLLYRTIGLEHGAVVFVEDVTELRRQQLEVELKQTTIREVHHRVKNNLQTVAALLRMQARRTDNGETKEALGVAVERINSMAAVHALLSTSQEERLDWREVCAAVIDSIAASMRLYASDIRIELRAPEGIVLPASLITSLAMVLTELIHNAYEHGFKIRTPDASSRGVITVTLSEEAGELILDVGDDGEGLASDFVLETAAHLGLSIVVAIVEQDLSGSVRAYNDAGAHFEVRIPRGEQR